MALQSSVTFTRWPSVVSGSKYSRALSRLDHGIHGLQPVAGIPRWLALQALEQFAFRELGCVYLEVADRAFTLEDGKRAGFEQRLSGSYESDLIKSEEELFRSMDPCYRRRVRKAARLEVAIEEAPATIFSSRNTMSN